MCLKRGQLKDFPFSKTLTLILGVGQVTLDFNVISILEEGWWVDGVSVSGIGPHGRGRRESSVCKLAYQCPSEG